MIRPTGIVRQLDRAATCGFIGLGAMGRGMAANLLNKTFEGKQGIFAPGASKPAFVAYDAFPQATSDFLTEHTNAYQGRDILPASSPAGLARLAGTIVTMLPSSAEVEEVYLGENGLIETLAELSAEQRKQTLLIDSTTLDMDVAKRVNAEMAKIGIDMLDTPVSGGVVGAQAGTLSFMVGGTPEAFARAKPFLDLMGKRVIHCGASGTGLAAKICNNLLLGINMAGTAEAMLLGDSLGLAPDLLASVLNTSTGKCWPSEINNPAPGALPSLSPPSDRGYSGGFLAKLMAKDLNLAMQAAKNYSTPLPVGGLATTLYNTLKAHDEFANKDFSVIYEYLRIAREGGKLNS